MAGKPTIDRHLQLAQGKDFVELERRRVRESMVFDMVENIEETRREYRNPISIEDFEVRSRAGISSSSKLAESMLTQTFKILVTCAVKHDDFTDTIDEL